LRAKINSHKLPQITSLLTRSNLTCYHFKEQRTDTQLPRCLVRFVFETQTTTEVVPCFRTGFPARITVYQAS